MTRFFRKIRRKLLTGVQIGKYLKYAAGEIILVMIGILLALQVNNWNEARIERKSEIKYLKNIELDLQKDMRRLSELITFRKKRQDGTAILIGQVNGLPVTDLTELTFNVVNSLKEDKFTPNNGTYTELVSSGNFNILSNDSIKILLLELEKLYKDNDFGVDHETFEYREYLSRPLMQSVNINQLMPVYSGEKTIQEQQITLDTFSTLFQNASYKNGLVISNAVSQGVIDRYMSIEKISAKILELIKTEIE